MRIPPDGRRCMYTKSGGARCRLERMEGHDSCLCYFHWAQGQQKAARSRVPASLAEVVGPRERLDSARAVNRFLTRIVRLLAEGRISARDASALGYVGQLISNTLPLLGREADRREEEKPAQHEEDVAGFEAAVRSLLESNGQDLGAPPPQGDGRVDGEAAQAALEAAGEPLQAAPQAEAAHG